jgi:hypothetical protein
MGMSMLQHWRGRKWRPPQTGGWSQTQRSEPIPGFTTMAQHVKGLA